MSIFFSTTVVIFNIFSGEVCSRVNMCCSGAIFVCEKHFYFVLLSENAQGAFFLEKILFRVDVYIYIVDEKDIL